MKKQAVYFLIFISCLLPLPGLLAVGGISNSKLIMPSADPIDKDTVEFEATTIAYRAKSEFDEYGNLHDIPGDYNMLVPSATKTTYNEEALDFRMDMGLTSVLEAGMTVRLTKAGLARDKAGPLPGESSFGDGFLFGAKYLFNPDSKYRFAYQGGINMETVNWSMDYESGIIFTADFTERFSMDFDIEYLVSSARDDGSGEKAITRGVVSNIGVGFRYKKLILISELNYSESHEYRSRILVPGKEYQPYYNYNPASTISLIGLPPYQTISLPVTGEVSRETPEITERVRQWQKLLMFTTGFTYAPNDKTLLTFILSRDIYGVNAYAGNTLAVSLTYTFL